MDLFIHHLGRDLRERGIYIDGQHFGAHDVLGTPWQIIRRVGAELVSRASDDSIVDRVAGPSTTVSFKN